MKDVRERRSRERNNGNEKVKIRSICLIKRDNPVNEVSSDSEYTYPTIGNVLWEIKGKEMNLSMHKNHYLE